MTTRPLVVRFGALGDMVILTVLLRHLSARLGTPIDILSSGGWTRPLLEGQPGVGTVHVIRSRKQPYWLSGEQRQLVRRLHARGSSPTWLCDQDNRKVQWLLQRAGWQPTDCCDYRNLPDVPGPHYCDLLLRFAYRNPAVLGGTDLPLTATDAYGQLTVSEGARADLQRWLQARGLQQRRLLLIQAGNKRTMRIGSRQRASNDKYWPEANWAVVVRGLRELQPEAAILLLGVEREAALNDEIAQLAATREVHNVAGELPIPRLMALCESAAGMVSVDTGPAHLAAAVGCPVIALFGRSDPGAYAPRGPRGAGVCLTGHVGGEKSMLGIAPRAVLDAASGLLLTPYLPDGNHLSAY